MTSAGLAAASDDGVGQRASHSRQSGSTRATGVCCSITSLTSTAQASTPGRRHGRSRAAVANQSTITSPVSGPGSRAGRVGRLVTGVQCAVPGERRAGSGTTGGRASVVPVLHPVGPLRARVYWRRRLAVLTVLLALVG